MLGKKGKKKPRTHHWWELWQLLLICLQHSCLSAMVVSSQVSLQMPAAEDCYEAVGRLNPSLAYWASCCSVTWENLPHFFLKCISLVWAVVRFPKRKTSPVASHAVGSGMLISFCSHCLRKLDARWSLWKRLRLATPLAWRKSNSWMKRKWKKVELNATIASDLSDYIFSPSSWLSFYVAEWSTLCCCWTAPHIRSPPSLLTTGWTYRVVLFLCPHSCRLCAAVIVWRAHFFFHSVFSSLTCSVISRVFAQFEQRGEQNPLTNESERGLYFKIIVFLTSCYLPPGGQPVLRASVQYEILW